MTSTASDRSAPSVVDTETELGATITARLNSEHVIWLTTVGPSGTPQPNPVWFQWRDGEFLIFSQDDKPKVRNIIRNSRVSLNLNCTEWGDEVTVLTGAARIADGPPSEAEIAAYTTKYTEGMVSISMTPEQFYAEYTAAIRITPDRLRGF